MQLCDMHVVFQPKEEHISNSVHPHPQPESDLDAVNPAPNTDLPSCSIPHQIINEARSCGTCKTTQPPINCVKKH